MARRKKINISDDEYGKPSGYSAGVDALIDENARLRKEVSQLSAQLFGETMKVETDALVITEKDKERFHWMKDKAFDNDGLALIRVLDRKTNEIVPVMVLTNQLPDGGVDVHPLAVILHDETHVLERYDPRVK